MSEPTPPAPGAAPRLTPGMRLGPYEILAALGAGGMGEVFRARDSRLGREVAVKVLPAAVAGDPERLRRFEQEARTAGQLDHPNLLTVFDVGTHDGVAYLVTELLRGETLRARLAAGPLARAEAVSLAAEYARGLAAAHARGVVHRDLKPENLFVTRDGHARILDFGLARIVREPAAGPADADGRTDTALTSPGMILGTAGYMSPEQVRGEPADARSDLFCLGAVIYEMLTGTRAFAGGTAAETMGAILHQEPKPGLAPFTDEHDPLWRVVRRCLEKDRERRFESAGDLAFALEMAAGRSATAGPVVGEPGRPGPAWPAYVAVAAGLVAVAVVAWAAFALRAPRATPSLMAAATLTPLTVDPGDEENPSFAPDGETIAYASDRSGNYEVYLQQVAGGPAVNLTQDGADDVQPAFSPDGRTIAFVSTRRRGVRLYIPAPGVPLVGGDLWTMPALGGTPRRIADNAYLPSWSPDGRYLYFSSGPWYRSTIQRVPVGGGAAETVAVRLPKGATAPYLLSANVSPDGRWLLFWARDVVYVMPLAGGEARRLAYGRYPTFMDGGRGVLYCDALPGRNHSLWRLDFDPARGASFGRPMPLTAGTVEAAAPAVSPRGGQIAFTAVDRKLNLEALPFDADGAGVRGSPIAVTAGNHRVRFFSISPDGRDIVYEDERGAESHLWRQSVAGGEAVQLTLEPGYAEAFPRWSPDGRMIEFTRGPAGQPEETGGPWLMSADGGNPHAAGVPLGRRGAWLPGSEGLLFELRSGRFARFDIASGRTTEVDSSLRAVPIFCLSNDSRWIAYQYAASGSVDVLAVPLDASAPPRVVVQTPADDGHSFFSPNGRWLYWQPNHLNLYRVPGPGQGWREAPAQQMTHFPERGLYLEEPQISFDGRTLAYVRASVRGDLWLLRLGGADSVAVATGRR